jgi:hypothetical protein
MANRECLDCHSTGLVVSYDRAAEILSTKFTEPGVACECCHGPGRRHAESGEPADIVHPRKVGAELGLAICGQCHGPREPIFPVLQAAHRFHPGRPYEDYYRVLMVRAVLTDSSEAPTVRVAAATLLAVAYPREAVSILAPLLKDPERVLRAGIAYALGYLPLDEAQKAVSRVRPLLHDSYLPARESAALLLAFANAPDGEEALRMLANAPTSEDLPQPHYELAIRAGRRGALAEAELNKTLDRQFYHTFALVALADLYEARQQPELARQALAEAVRFGMRDSRVMQRLHMMSGR